MLTVEDLNVYYGGIHALKGISFQVRQREIVTLIGANGAGTTTTLKTISGLVRARTGRIRYQDQEISSTPAHIIAREGLCHVPEGRRVFADMTVAENLALGAYHRRDQEGLRRDLEWFMSCFPAWRSGGSSLPVL